MRERIALLGDINQYVGKYFTRKQVLKQVTVYQTKRLKTWIQVSMMKLLVDRYKHKMMEATNDYFRYDSEC